MTDIVDIFKHLGKLCPVDSGRWEHFSCAPGRIAGLSAFNFADGATLSILSKKNSRGAVISSLCVCTPFSKDVPVLYLLLCSNRFGARVSIELFDTCACKSSHLPNLDTVRERFGPMPDFKNKCHHCGKDKAFFSLRKFSFGNYGKTMVFELCKDFISCYADILSKRPSFCKPEDGDCTIVNRQQNLVDRLFFLDDSYGDFLLEGIKVPDRDEFLDFIHFCAVPHLKIDRALLV